MQETNDMVLTQQRQEEIRKNGVPKGFPIFVIRNRYNSILGVFASKKNAEAKFEELQQFMWVKLDLIYVEDIRALSYELENLN
jgi:hypothetical protein